MLCNSQLDMGLVQSDFPSKNVPVDKVLVIRPIDHSSYRSDIWYIPSHRFQHCKFHLDTMNNLFGYAKDSQFLDDTVLALHLRWHSSGQRDMYDTEQCHFLWYSNRLDIPHRAPGSKYYNCLNRKDK